MIPPSYVVQPGQEAYDSHPQYVYTTSYSVPPGYAPHPGLAPPGYQQAGFAPPPGQAPPGYAFSPGQAPPGYPQPGYAPLGYAPPGYAAYPAGGYPPGSVSPERGVPYGMQYPYAMPVGQIPPEFTAHAAYAAFAAGMSPSAYTGIARTMGVPQQPQDNDPRNRITTGHWDTGLFSCCTHCVPNGLIACFCPCVSLAQITTRLGSPARYSAVLTQFACLWLLPVVARILPEIMFRSMGLGDVGLPPIVNLPLLMPLLMTGLVVGNLRQRIRIRYKIPASPCGDCATGCCCTPCAIAQIATHVKSYTPGNCSFDPPDMLPPFQ